MKMISMSKKSLIFFKLGIINLRHGKSKKEKKSKRFTYFYVKTQFRFFFNLKKYIVRFRKMRE